MTLNTLSPHQVPADTVHRKHDLDSIQVRFERFHATNPHVYEWLVREARAQMATGIGQLAIADLFEDLRRWSRVRTNTTENYKVSNDFRAHYARLIMAQEPDLKGFFTTRQQRTK
jgi:hypothetical protein